MKDVMSKMTSTKDRKPREHNGYHMKSEVPASVDEWTVPI